MSGGGSGTEKCATKYSTALHSIFNFSERVQKKQYLTQQRATKIQYVCKKFGRACKIQYCTQHLSRTIQHWTQKRLHIETYLKSSKTYLVPVHFYAKDSTALNIFTIWTQSMCHRKDITALNSVVVYRQTSTTYLYYLFQSNPSM